jgi:hypothetical protein
MRVAAACHDGGYLPVAEALLGSGDTTEFELAAVMVGNSGRRLPQEALEQGLSGAESTVGRTLHCLGLTDDPRLAGIAADRRLPDSTRGAARWWAGRGGRIID